MKNNHYNNINIYYMWDSAKCTKEITNTSSSSPLPPEAKFVIIAPPLPPNHPYYKKSIRKIT